MPLDFSALKPVEEAAPAEQTPGLDFSGLKPLDFSGLTPLDQPGAAGGVTGAGAGGVATTFGGAITTATALASWVTPDTETSFAG